MDYSVHLEETNILTTYLFSAPTHITIHLMSLKT